MKNIMARLRVWWIIRRLRGQKCGKDEAIIDSLVNCGAVAVGPLIEALSLYHPHELSDKFRPKVNGTFGVIDDSDKCRSYWTLRQCAVAALGRIRDARAIEPIGKLLLSGYKREYYRIILQGKPFGTLGAGNCDRGEDPSIIETAIQALVAFWSGDSRQLLISALGLTAFPDGVYSESDCRTIRGEIIKALRQMGEHKWGAVSDWDDVYRVEDPRLSEPLKIALQEIEYVDTFSNWEKQEAWAGTAGDIADKLKAMGDISAADVIANAVGRVKNFGAMFKLSDTELRDDAVERMEDAIKVLRGKSSATAAGVLVLVFAADQGTTPQLVKSAAGQAGFLKGEIKQMAGPTSMTKGQAEALLARIASEDGVDYLSRPFTIGRGTAGGVPFAFINIQG